MPLKEKKYVLVINNNFVCLEREKYLRNCESRLLGLCWY